MAFSSNTAFHNAPGTYLITDDGNGKVQIPTGPGIAESSITTVESAEATEYSVAQLPSCQTSILEIVVP